MTGEAPGNEERTVAWDGLGLAAPASWEPARLGLGYLRLEDVSGPRLTLRWQRQQRPLSPDKVLARLTRRKILTLDKSPHGAVEAMLSALPPECKAVPCAEASGRGADGVLLSLDGGRLAVLAAVYARPDEPAAAWVRAARSLSAESPGLFDLYDVRGEAPPGFRLASFTVQLGHYHFLYRSGGDFLDYHRFAPAEVILRSKSLESWAGEVFGQELGPGRTFVPGTFNEAPAARFSDAVPGGAVRLLAARVFPAFRFARAMAWTPHQAKILAVVARHKGDLSPEAFEEVCHRYVVLAQ